LSLFAILTESGGSRADPSVVGTEGQVYYPRNEL